MALAGTQIWWTTEVNIAFSRMEEGYENALKDYWRRWNRRGAMMTDVYQHVRHHRSIEDLADWAAAEGLPVVGVDNLPGASPLETTELPRRCLLLFGQEGPGLSEPARAASDPVVSIAQYGSTRSINAGVAAGIAMHTWIRRWANPPD